MMRDWLRPTVFHYVSFGLCGWLFSVEVCVVCFCVVVVVGISSFVGFLVLICA